jgi:hypothetical protein
MRRLIPLACLALALAAAAGLHGRQSGELTVQSYLHLRFVERPSLETALARYPKHRAPFYPMVLRGASGLGLAPETTDGMLLAATLGLLWVAARRFAPGAPACAVVAPFALGHFVLAGFHQHHSENLALPLGVLVLITLARYRAGRGAADLAVATLAAAGLCLNRYFALFWIVPLGLAVVAWPGGLSRRRRLAHAAFWLLSVVPLGCWMAAAHRETGSWTGTERTTERHLPASVSHWAELQGLGPSLRLAGCTLSIDLFAPDCHASLGVVARPHTHSSLEVAALLLAALGFVPIAGAAWRGRREAWPDPLPALHLLSYAAVTLVLWAGGNNDPIHSRFLLPAYPYLGLVLLQLWATGAAGAPRWSRFAALASYGLLLAVQLQRSLYGVESPLR